VHVIEEARHMRYARDEVARQVDRLGPTERVLSRLVLGVVAAMSTGRLVHPQVYAAVGLDPLPTARLAHANPSWIETRRNAARKAVDFFTDLGLITSTDRRLFWRRAALVA
jgi:hypothetical protein